MIRGDDGTNYTITDVSRYDKDYFADGLAGPFPEVTCDWSQFDQPELPKVEVRRFNDPDGNISHGSLAALNRQAIADGIVRGMKLDVTETFSSVHIHWQG